MISQDSNPDPELQALRQSFHETLLIAPEDALENTYTPSMQPSDQAASARNYAAPEPVASRAISEDPSQWLHDSGHDYTPVVLQNLLRHTPFESELKKLQTIYDYKSSQYPSVLDLKREILKGHTGLKAETLMWLISRGESLGKHWPEGWTAMQCAILTGCLETAETLRSAGVSVNAGPLVQRPLNIALAFHNYDAVSWLIKVGADVNKQGALYNPFRMALINQPKAMVDLVLKRDLTEDGPFHLSGQNSARLRKVLKELTTYSTYKTILHGLINESYSLRNLTWLLQAGADLNAVDFHGRTPLHDLCCRDFMTENPFDIIGASKLLLLLAYEAELDLKDHYGCTPLHYVARDWRWGFRQLCRAGADMNIKDNNGESARKIAERHFGSGELDLDNDELHNADHLLEAAAKQRLSRLDPGLHISTSS